MKTDTLPHSAGSRPPARPSTPATKGFASSARKHDASGVELTPTAATALVAVQAAGWQVGAWVRRGKGYSVGLMKRAAWPVIFHEIARGDLPAFARQAGKEVAS